MILYKLDRNVTKYIKGIAIALMVAHHLFLDNSMYGPVLNAFGKSCKLCVGIYAFLSGFAYNFAKKKNYNYSLKRIWFLLERYWLQMFLIFFPLTIFAGGTLTFKIVVINLFAWGPNINWFSWYVYFYIFLMLALPIYARLCKGKFFVGAVATIFVSWVVEMGMVILTRYYPNQLASNLIDCFIYFPVAAIGYLIARYKIFDKVQEKLSYLSYEFVSLSIGVVFVTLSLLGRYFCASVAGLYLDVIYVPLFVFGTMLILTLLSNIVKEKGMVVFSVLGKYSTEVWFLHSVFFSQEVNRNFKKLLWYPQNPLLVFLWCFILCLPVSIILHWTASRLDKIFLKFWYKQNNSIKEGRLIK